jgi:hypothetical protein
LSLVALIKSGAAVRALGHNFKDAANVVCEERRQDLGPKQRGISARQLTGRTREAKKRSKEHCAKRA